MRGLHSNASSNSAPPDSQRSRHAQDDLTDPAALTVTPSSGAKTLDRAVLQRSRVSRNPGVTPTKNNNDLPEGKPLICLVAGVGYGWQKIRILDR